MKSSSSEDPRKKQKLGEDSAIISRNFSKILTECFTQEGNYLKGYLYKVNCAPLFGILLPIKYPEIDLLAYIDISMIELDLQSILRRFQHELWSDLFKASKDPKGRVSEANYFIVPLQDNLIDWNIINRSVGKLPLLKLTDYLISTRDDLILKASYRANTLWKYTNEINHNTTNQNMFENLYGKDYAKLPEVIEKYTGYDPIDILFDESFSNPPAKELRNMISLGIINEIDENSQIIIVKQLKSIKSLYNLGNTVTKVWLFVTFMAANQKRKST